MGRMKYFYLLIFILIIVLSFSCIKDAPSDFDNPDSNWNPSFSFPGGYASLAMDEVSGFDTLLLLIDSLTGYPFWVEEVDIPMTFSMPFSMQELNSYSDEIVSIMFRLNTSNGFPAQAAGQIYFQDINFVTIDSLFVDGALILNPGTPVNNGETVSPSKSQTDVIIYQERINELDAVQNILIVGSINNLNLDTTLIDYYPNYNLDLQLGIQVELNMSISSK